jgi:hypothetical protein
LNQQPAAPFAFHFFKPLPIQIEVFDAPLTSDAGLLPLRQFDRASEELLAEAVRLWEETREPQRPLTGSGIGPVPGRWHGLWQ